MLQTLSWLSIWKGIFIDSYNSPLWYVRYLIVFSILSIALFPIIKKIPILVPVIAFWGWCLGIPFITPLRWDAVFFYSIGSVAGCANFDSKNKLYPSHLTLVRISYTMLLAWFGISAIHAWYLCRLSTDVLLLGTFDRLHHILGIVGIFLGCITMLSLTNLSKKVTLLYGARQSFLIFVCHHPLIFTLKKASLKIIGVSSLKCIVVYFVSCFITILVIVALGEVLSRFCPRCYNFMNGQRA